MAQISFIIKEDITKKNKVYFQLYEFSDIVIFRFLRFVINKIFFQNFLKNIPFLNKILFAQFFLNSEDSSTLLLKKNNGKFNLSVGKNQIKSKEIINSLINKINNEKNLKIKISKFFLKKFYVGESYHWGSSFKMKKNNDSQ